MMILLHARAAATYIWLALALQSMCAYSSSSNCGKTAEGGEICQSSDETSLLQGRVNSVIGTDPEEIGEEQVGQNRRNFVRGPFPPARPMIEYFKNWAQGKIDNHLARIIEDPTPEEGHVEVMLNEQAAKKDASAAMTANQVAASFQSIQVADCAGSSNDLRYEAFSHYAGKDGIAHSLLVGSDGNLQYVAARRSLDGVIQAIVSDPPACHRQELSVLERNDSSNETLRVEYQKYGGAAETITENDKLVIDCKDAFQEMTKKECHLTYDVSVLSATVSIADGLEITMLVRLCINGKCTKHLPRCNFRTQKSHVGAVFLQDVTASHLTDEYLEISMAAEDENADFCTCLNASDPLANASSTPLETFSLGELSHYKGFEHVNDDLPQLDLIAAGLSEEPLPDDLDIRGKELECFPSLPSKATGSETVRNQGTCGSCWAFAAATVTMHTLCISSKGGNETFFSPGDRYEVSVQELMSCRIDGRANLGCGGGYMAAVNSGFMAHGLARERDNLYRCGGGNPKKHFEQRKPDCAKFPWGGTCTQQRVKQWVWGGVAGVDGEQDMRTVLSKGFTLYGTLAVYMDFMRLRGNDIVEKRTGRMLGGHAISIIGYGSQSGGSQSGTKYWLIQNSWGTDGWGVNGFGKVIRGVNYCGIESGAYMVRAWVEGGRHNPPPPCTDSKAGSGLSRTGRAPFVDCQEVKHLCKYRRYKKVLQSRCPVTCGTCGPSYDYSKTGAEQEGSDKKSGSSPKSWIIVSIGMTFAHLSLYI